jgi:DNA-binding MarR family transcriptional regulator
VWTRDSLAQRFGIGSALAGRILAELTGAGLIRRLPGPDDEYTAAGAGY